MTWKSHSAIAAAITLPFAPALVPVAVIGSTAPDWSEWILKFFGIRIQHRGATHYVYWPILCIAISVLLYPLSPRISVCLAAFGFGYLSHWFADALTVSGVPVSGSSSYRVHFFGGRLRTGEMPEYLISFGLLAISVFIFSPTTSAISALFQNDPSGSPFSPYRMDYAALYEKHIIDESERLATRFKFF